MSKTIDEDVLPVIEQRLREMRKEQFTLEQAIDEVNALLTEWLTQQKLDPRTFSAHERDHLFLKALYEIQAEVS